MTTEMTVMANQQLRMSVIEPCKESVGDSPALMTGFITDADSCQSAMLCVVVVNMSVLFCVTSILYEFQRDRTGNNGSRALVVHAVVTMLAFVTKQGHDYLGMCRAHPVGLQESI